jgi:hypothetical protein
MEMEHSRQIRKGSPSRDPVGVPVTLHGVAAADFDNDGMVELLVKMAMIRRACRRTTADTVIGSWSRPLGRSPIATRSAPE